MIDLLAANRVDVDRVNRERAALAEERDDLVARARSAGVTWRQIEDLTGMSRQGLTTKGVRNA
jgi:hypothetical protein